MLLCGQATCTRDEWCISHVLGRELVQYDDSHTGVTCINHVCVDVSMYARGTSSCDVKCRYRGTCKQHSTTSIRRSHKFKTVTAHIPRTCMGKKLVARGNNLPPGSGFHDGDNACKNAALTMPHFAIADMISTYCCCTDGILDLAAVRKYLPCGCIVPCKRCRLVWEERECPYGKDHRMYTKRQAKTNTALAKRIATLMGSVRREYVRKLPRHMIGSTATSLAENVTLTEVQQIHYYSRCASSGKAHLMQRPIQFSCGCTVMCAECAVRDKVNTCPCCGARVTATTRSPINVALHQFLSALFPREFADAVDPFDNFARVAYLANEKKLDTGISNITSFICAAYRRCAIEVLKKQETEDNRVCSVLVPRISLVKFCECGLVCIPTVRHTTGIAVMRCPLFEKGAKCRTAVNLSEGQCRVAGEEYKCAQQGKKRATKRKATVEVTPCSDTEAKRQNAMRQTKLI